MVDSFTGGAPGDQCMEPEDPNNEEDRGSRNP